MVPLAAPTQRTESLVEQFSRHWRSSTNNNNITLHGFYRFKNAHLLNLRFLDDKIAKLDYTIYQAGLTLRLDQMSSDSLGLKHSMRDPGPQNIATATTREFIIKLRDFSEAI
jgi:hypothetical protein